MKRTVLQPGDGFAVPLFGDPVPAQGAMFADVPSYSSNCTKCRYTRPGATTTHRDHVDLACPACGAIGSHTCRGTAQSLL